MTEKKSEQRQLKESKKDNDIQNVKISSIETKKAGYGENFQSHLLEQYKMYIEMMDRISERRGKTNAFYLSLLSGLLTLLSFSANVEILGSSQYVFLLLLSSLGLALCVVWWVNINSYKQLNSLKFKVINEMEQELPFPCYHREWEILGQEKKKSRQYRRLTKVEKYIPLILAIPYLGLFIYSAYNLLK